MLDVIKVAIGSDHGGFVLKQAVLDFLKNDKTRAYEILDMGTDSEERCDYPDFALKAARAVSMNEADRAILMCGTGIGMSITANKVPGIRAAVCNDVDSAKISRAHNNTNVIALGGRIIKPEQVAEILSAWFETPFEGDRHIMRLNKIAQAEKSTLRAELPSGGQVVIFNHPLVQHKISIIRDKDTTVKDFRELVQEIAGLMVYEITRNLPLTEVEVETPIAKTKCCMLAGRTLAIVPVLRAGLGMVEGILKLVPNAKVGHIGLYRNPETFEPVEYYCKLPDDIASREVFVVDPMLATGGSATAAISMIKKRGAKKISLVNLIGVPEGIKRVHQDHPEVDIYIAALDSHLNEHAYIVPGLGDAGDRLFGTK